MGLTRELLDDMQSMVGIVQTLFHPIWGMRQLAFPGSNQMENNPNDRTSHERNHHG
jgi:hypothetical protein